MLLERLDGRVVEKVIMRPEFADVHYLRAMLLSVFTALGKAQSWLGDPCWQADKLCLRAACISAVCWCGPTCATCLHAGLCAAVHVSHTAAQAHKACVAGFHHADLRLANVMEIFSPRKSGTPTGSTPDYTVNGKDGHENGVHLVRLLCLQRTLSNTCCSWHY